MEIFAEIGSHCVLMFLLKLFLVFLDLSCVLLENLLVLIGWPEVCRGSGSERFDGRVAKATLIERSGAQVVLVVRCLKA